MAPRYWQKTRCFLSGEQGGVETISFVLWVPMIMGFFMLMADVSYIMFNRSNIARITEDANRLYSIGILTSDLEAEEAIWIGMSPSADSDLASVNSFIEMGMVRTEVSVPISDIDMFGIVARLLVNGNISITASHFKEHLEI